jgi:electron transfer flavoprotein alpha subunit
MIQARSAVIRCRVLLSRSYASAASPHALVFLEHNNDAITSGSLSALTAATKLGGQVTGLLVGSPGQVPNAVEKAKKYRHRDSFPSIS